MKSYATAAAFRRALEDRLNRASKEEGVDLCLLIGSGGLDLPPDLRRSKQPIHLDLGSVKDMASVTLNGTPVGVVWCEPFQLEITGAVKPTGNVLRIDVVNKWSNRLMGDEVLKESYTTGNASHGPSLYSSGLLGPVKLGQPARQE